MDAIGNHVVELQDLIRTVIDPCPAWLPSWQLEAEHVLFLAHGAKNAEDYEKLKMLDEEAKKLVEKRETKLSEKRGK